MRFSASLDWGGVARNVTTALVGPPTKLKPRWDVHLSGDDDQLGR